jgi:hypothetical protein
MISIEDCLAMCGLDQDQVDAICEHEHIPEIEAAAFADALLNSPGGPARILDMLVDDIRAACDRGDTRHAAELTHAMRRFVDQHPEAAH